MGRKEFTAKGIGPAGLQVIFDDGRYCPTFFCDMCGTVIKESGNYLHLIVVDKIEPEIHCYGELYYLHKQCTWPFERRNQVEGATWGWGELKDLPVQIAANLGLSVKTKWINSFQTDYVLRGAVRSP